jgi:hypothetical protein
MRIREHRRVENTEDFSEWGWGDKPSGPVPSDEIVVELFKEWAESIASEAHEKSCAAGAAIAFEELAKNGFFVLDDITDDGLVLTFQGTDQFTIRDELNIAFDAGTFEDPQRISAHLRRLADAIDAGTQEEQSPP